MATKKKQQAKKAGGDEGAPEGKEKKKLTPLEMAQKLEKAKDIIHVELRQRTVDEGMSFGILSVDLIVGGCYYGSEVTQIYGPPGVGKSSFGYKASADLSRQKVFSQFFDHEATTDQEYAARLGASFGKDNPLFRYYKPNDGVATYDMMLNMMQNLDDMNGGVPQVGFFIDTVATMPTRGEMESWEDNKRMAQRAAMHSEWWGRLKTQISKKNVVLIALNQIRSAAMNPYASPESIPGGNAWAFSTDNLIKVSKGKMEEDPNGDIWSPMKFKTIKNKHFIPLQDCEILLRLGVGIDPASDVMEFLTKTGRMKKVQRQIGKMKGKQTFLVIDGIDPKIDGEYRPKPFAGLVRRQQDVKEDEGLINIPAEMDSIPNIYAACRKLILSGAARKLYMQAKRDKAKNKDEEGAVDKAPTEEQITKAAEVEIDSPEQQAEEAAMVERLVARKAAGKKKAS